MSGDRGEAPPRQITIAEMNGRIEEIERQRDAALNRCAILSGTVKLMQETLAMLKSEVDRLNACMGVIQHEDPAQN